LRLSSQVYEGGRTSRIEPTMDNAPAAKIEPGPVPAEVVSFLASLLGGRQPGFVMILGTVGSGKSTLLRAVVPRLTGARAFLTYQTGPPTGGATGSEPTISMLLLRPSSPSREGDTATGSTDVASMLAFGPQSRAQPSAATSPLTEATARLLDAGGGCFVVDSWDRQSATFLRAQAAQPEEVVSFTASLTALAELQTTLVSSPVSLLLTVTPELGAPLLSIADTVVTLQSEEQPHGRVRVAVLVKSRGLQPGQTSFLYTLDGGKFRSFGSLPTGFRPTGAPADPDPEPGASTLWPGSAAFAGAFGRLRPGGVTGITHPDDFPVSLLQALVAPVALHTLQRAGRVVWIPAPSVHPVQVIELLRRLVPDDWLRERFRILSASGPDPTLGDLRIVLLPLGRDPNAEPEPRGPSPPGVRPLFPGIMRFYREARTEAPNVLVASFEGLRAVAATANLTIDERTMPVIVANYGRLPHFHLIGHCAREDPVVAHLRPGVDTLCDIDMVHGRPVLFGVRPRTVPYVMDWPEPSRQFELIPVR
jgi:hypothetical protein